MIEFMIPAGFDAYMDDFVPLAEGFQELGVPYRANRPYWSSVVSGPTLFSTATVSTDAVKVRIYSYRAFQYFSPNGIALKPALDWVSSIGDEAINVLIDNADGYTTASTEHYWRFHRVLRTHMNRRCGFGSNVLPWALGFGNRVLRALPSHCAPCSARNRQALMNFGASHPYEHQTRRLFSQRFSNAASKHVQIDYTKDDLSRAPTDPWDRLMWEQTQKRHCRAYYERLAESQVVAAFCGELIPPAPYRPSYLVGGGIAELKRKVYELLAPFDHRPLRSIQWDSWRFWEGLVAGCVVFNIDLDYYGVRLPVMPENGKHYIGLRLDRIEEGVDEVLRDPASMSQIAQAGRTWALSNYAPTAIARRFLWLIGEETSSLRLKLNCTDYDSVLRSG